MPHSPFAPSLTVAPFPEQVEEREERGKQNGGLYEEEEEEEEETPKQHRKAERTLRYTDTATTQLRNFTKPKLFVCFCKNMWRCYDVMDSIKSELITVFDIYCMYKPYDLEGTAYWPILNFLGAA